MSLTLSIFGGMLLTAVLYVLNRAFRLSRHWAATFATALPTAAYLIYAFAARPGLDAVTLHLVVYPTVAILLAILDGARARLGARLHWAPKVLMVFFALTVALMGAFVYIASHGLPPGLAAHVLPNTEGKRLHTGFAGVVAHGEDAAKGIGHHRRMEDRLAQIGWNVRVERLDELRAGRPAPVAVLITDRAGRPVDTATVTLALARPGQPASVEVPLPCADGGCRGSVPALEAGTWVADLHLLAPGERPIVLEHAIDLR